jgi:hypothetical protein
MDIHNTLLDYVQSLKVIDTHEHFPLEFERPQNIDILEEWLSQYLSYDFISAGMSGDDLGQVRDSSKDICAPK